MTDYEALFLREQRPYLDRYLAGEPFPPFEVEIQMSSSCNLSCSWCVGSKLSGKRLKNTLRANNIHRITDGLLACEINGLKIKRVKFSGFIGEPLVNKAATLQGMRLLRKAGVEVGLFTNGELMTEDTWDTLSFMDYVHVSQLTPKALKNIRGLVAHRGDDRLKINVGYVIHSAGYSSHDAYAAAALAKGAGADSIRFKYDITRPYRGRSEEVEEAFGDLADDSFDVIEVPRYAQVWDHTKGCHFQNFLGTIGSDGGVYMCDHTTTPDAICHGNALERSFHDIWMKRLEHACVCKCSTCPPYGDAVNRFIDGGCGESS